MSSTTSNAEALLRQKPMVPASYHHNQSVAATVWVIQHNLGLLGAPTILAYENDGAWCDYISVEVIDRLSCRVTFPKAVAGDAVVYVLGSYFAESMLIKTELMVGGVALTSVLGELHANGIQLSKAGHTHTFAQIESKPTTLTGYGITDAQPLDAELTAVAALTTNGLVAKTAAGSMAARSIAVSGTGLSVANADGVDGNPAITLTSTSANTASTVVARDASGNFAAGTITAELTGNAASSTKLFTSRNISLTGDATGTASFNGTANAAIATTLTSTGVTAGTYQSVTVDAKGRVSAGTNPTTLSGYGITDAQPVDAELTAFAGLTTNGLVAKTAAGVAVTRSVAVSGTGLSVSNADGVSGNPTVTLTSSTTDTASTIVARDSSGNFSAGTITAALTGNASTATKLSNARTLSVSGDATGSTSFDGTANAGITMTLAASGVDAGVYSVVAVDAKGRVTAGDNPTTLSGYGITDAQPLDAELTALAGMTTNGLVAKTAAGVVATRSIAVSGTGLSVSNADGIAGNPTVAITSASANTASTLVARDSSGNFSANTVTAALVGNASTATKLATSRTLSVSGDVSGSASFDGTTNAAISVTLAASGVAAGTYRSVSVDAKGRVSAGTNPTTLSDYGITDAQPLDAELTAFAGLTTNGLVAKTAAGTAVTRSIEASGTGLSVSNADGVSGNPVVEITSASANTASTLVARDGSGNFSAGTVTAALTGNASTATKLATSRTLTISGDVAGSTSFDGTSNVTTTTALSTTGVTAGTYKSVTVDTKGRVSAGTNPTTLAGYGITDALPVASPAMTGVPTAPTAALNTSSTQIATTAFVQDRETPVLKVKGGIGWKMVCGTMNSRGGSSAPTLSVFRNNIYAYGFDKNTLKQLYTSFRIPYDYAPGTPIHIQIHWSTTSSNTTQLVRWGIEYTYAKGFGQDYFGSTSTEIVEQASVGSYYHMIAESSGLLTTEATPGGLILVRLYRDAANARDNLNDTAFGFECAMVYQIDRVATLNRAPNFYE